MNQLLRNHAKNILIFGIPITLIISLLFGFLGGFITETEKADVLLGLLVTSVTLLAGTFVMPIVIFYGCLNICEKLSVQMGNALGEKRSFEQLREQATSDLCILGTALHAAEEEVGKYCHNNHLYAIRDQARRNLGEKHKFYLELELAEEDWGLYIPKHS